MILRLALPMLLVAGVASADPPAASSSREKPSRHTMKQVWQDAIERAKRGEVGPDSSEAVRMAAALLSGEKLGAGGGWFGPSKLRHDWRWLAGRFDKDGDGRVLPAEFTAAKEFFERLDRDGDGAITAEDFDWSDNSPFVKQQAQVNRLFRMLDADGNGQLSAEEWQSRFKVMAKDKDHLTVEDLRTVLFPVTPGKGDKTKKGEKEKVPDIMRQAFFEGDAGSPFEGVRPNAEAPDFQLPTHDGKSTIRLSDFRGKKPVVLIFGSFT